MIGFGQLAEGFRPFRQPCFVESVRFRRLRRAGLYSRERFELSDQPDHRAFIIAIPILMAECEKDWLIHCPNRNIRSSVNDLQVQIARCGQIGVARR